MAAQGDRGSRNRKPKKGPVQLNEPEQLDLTFAHDQERWAREGFERWDIFAPTIRPPGRPTGAYTPIASAYTPETEGLL